MFLNTLKVFAAVMVVAGPAFAQANSSAPEARPAKVKKICRQEMVTGSMFPNRTCHTADEWKAIDEQNAANTENALSRRSAGRPGN